MTTFLEAQTAIDSRFAAAVVSIHAVPGGDDFVQVSPDDNSRDFEPSASVPYLRGYVVDFGGSQRIGVNEGFDRSNRAFMLQIMVPKASGRALVFAAYEAAKTHFKTSDDGLEFEEAPDLKPGSRDGEHFTSVAVFPYYFDRTS